MKHVARDENLQFVVNCDYPGKIEKNFTLVRSWPEPPSVRGLKY